MANINVVRLVAVTLTLGCSGGDLTLPGPEQPGAPLPAALIATSGDGQQAAPGAILEQPLAVQVVDSSSHPVLGALVRFSFLDSIAGASLDPTSVLTDEAGRASAVVRLGDSPGEQIIEAAVANTGVPELRAQFTVVAVQPGDNGGGRKGGRGGQHNGQDED
jgi:hypothetical protein